MEELKIGDVKLTWLNGGVTHLDGGAMFGVVPKPLWSKRYPCNDRNQIELRTDPILIQTKDKNYLVDSGIGLGKMTEKMKRNFGVLEESSVEESLSSLGLTSAEIDVVLMTHLHFDHACGISKWSDDQLVPAFPNAKIVVSKTEWNEMKNPNIRSKNTYWENNWKPVEHLVETFVEEVKISPEIRMIHTSGHSDGHSVLVIEQDNDIIIHMADLMPTHAHQNVLWVMAYDDYPMRSIAQKQKWMDIGLKRNAWYTFYHDAYYRAIKWDKEGNLIESVKRNR